MGDTCGTTECSGTTRLYNTSPWMRRHTKMLLLLRKLYHTPPPQHYKFNPSARQNTHLRPHMYKMLCLARETHLPCNTETHFSHTTPRRGISSPQPMLANAQTAVHKREPFATTKVFGKKISKEKKTLPAHSSDACEKSAASQNRQNDGNPFVHWYGRWFHAFVPTLVAANVHQDQVSILWTISKRADPPSPHETRRFSRSPFVEFLQNLPLFFKEAGIWAFENRDMVAK